MAEAVGEAAHAVHGAAIHIVRSEALRTWRDKLTVVLSLRCFPTDVEAPGLDYRMPTDVVMPQMGESIAEGTIVRWIKKVGDQVARDEPLFEISTDKVDAEIPSPAAGIVDEIRVAGGRDCSRQQRGVAIIRQADEVTKKVAGNGTATPSLSAAIASASGSAAAPAPAASCSTCRASI